MKYLMRRAFLNFKSSKKIYVFFFIEIILAGLILNIFSGLGYSSEKNMRKVESMIQNESIKISDYSASRSDDFYFTKENYEYISEKFKDKLSISYSVRERIFWGYDDSGKLENLNIVFANDQFFKLILNEDVEGFETGNKAYVGKRIMEKFMNLEGFEKKSPSNIDVAPINNFLMPIYMDGSELRFRDESFQVQELTKAFGENGEKTIKHYSSNFSNEESEHTKEIIDLDLNNAIILPIKYSEGIEQALMDSERIMDSMSLIKFHDSVKDNNTLYNIYMYLRENHEERFDYEFISRLDEFKRNAERGKEITKSINVILWFCMLIVIIGVNGLMLMNINRRKRSIAVATCIGATNNQIAKEIIFETLFITIPPAILSNLLSWFAAGNLIKLDGLEYEIPVYSYIIVFMISVGIAVIASILPVRKMRQFMPLEILRSSN